MARYQCSVCGYVYDEDRQRTPWGNLAGDWSCPVCGREKSGFEPLAEDAQAAVPSRAAFAHRVFGYVFLAIFLMLLVQMIPRLWTYQIEFPARTAVHISLGMGVGVLLLLKIAVVRFFRRLDQGLVPLLGTAILVGSVVLIGISVPAAFREALATGDLFGNENRQRVATLLAQIDLEEEECRRLSTADSLRAGQRILRQECIECHDLRTVLAQPRTPQNWLQTVRRMADRTTMLNPLAEEEQRQVTAYLIALSPDLQRSTQQQRQAAARRKEAVEAAAAVVAEPPEPSPPEPSPPAGEDVSALQPLFEAKCSGCHKWELVDTFPPASEADARDMVSRMVDEGLDASEEELSQIIRYLTETHAKQSE